MASSFGRVVLPLIPVLLGCSSSAEARQCPESPKASAAVASATPASPPTSEAPPVAGKTTPTPSTEGLVKPSETPFTVPSEQSLPELTLKITGMHIGGGPNDSETKRPFLEAIERGFTQMRDCYRKAEEPMKGGTYGVDLRVDRAGGHPTIQAVRSVMKGEALQSCLETVFAGLTFGKPVKGPTVLSVSVKFSLGE